LRKKTSKYNWNVVFNFIQFESQEQRDLHYDMFVKSIFCLKKCGIEQAESVEESKAA